MDPGIAAGPHMVAFVADAGVVGGDEPAAARDVVAHAPGGLLGEEVRARQHRRPRTRPSPNGPARRPRSRRRPPDARNHASGSSIRDGRSGSGSRCARWPTGTRSRIHDGDAGLRQLACRAVPSSASVPRSAAQLAHVPERPGNPRPHAAASRNGTSPRRPLDWRHWK